MTTPAPHEQRPKLAAVHRLAPAIRSDAELALAAAEGDPRAQSEAWDRYSSLVRGLLRRSLGAGDVQDAVQEVFIRFFRKLPDLREPAAVRSFLIGITLRVAAGELRKRRVRRWLRLTPTGVVPEQPGSELDDVARAALRRLYEILDQQSDDARLAFVLRHVQGMELTEVAGALNVSLATVKRKLARITPRIRAQASRDPLLRTYADEQLTRHTERETT